MSEYKVVIHREADEDGGGFWAEVEELPGCFASGETVEELKADMVEAIEQHLSAIEQINNRTKP